MHTKLTPSTKFIVSSLALLFSGLLVYAETQINLVNVTASVLGEKPIVNTVAPTAAINTGATVLTKIVGRNFDDVYGVSLDDSASTVLTGTPVLSSDCDINGDNCGGGGSYQKITGLSVPSGISPGIYNVLLTTPLGTNLLSDTKFTVNAPAPTSTPSISDIFPPYISLMAGINDSYDVEFNITDVDSAVVHFNADHNIQIAGGVWVDSHIPVLRRTTNADVGDGERVSFKVHSNSAGEQYGKLEIKVGDGTNYQDGNTSFIDVNVFVEPNW